ncbi:MAG: hypothetical protein H7839_17535 [Magnetococcus sp. YQC-5]
MQPTPGEKKGLQSILDKSMIPLPSEMLASLQSHGWIRLADNTHPIRTACRHELTALGYRALGLHDPTQTIHHGNAIGLEAETCEECGGSGQLFVLDEKKQCDPCPWCHGTGRITEILHNL